MEMRRAVGAVAAEHDRNLVAAARTERQAEPWASTGPGPMMPSAPMKPTDGSDRCICAP
jgi:hypothetical protein